MPSLLQGVQTQASPFDGKWERHDGENTRVQPYMLEPESDTEQTKLPEKWGEIYARVIGQCFL